MSLQVELPLTLSTSSLDDTTADKLEHLLRTYRNNKYDISDDTDFIEEADILTRPTTPDDTGLMHPLKAGEEEGTLVPAAQTIAPVVPDWVRTGRAFVPGIAYSTVPTHFLVVNPFLKPENEETGFAVVIVGKYVGVMAKLDHALTSTYRVSGGNLRREPTQEEAVKRFNEALAEHTVRVISS